LPTIFFSINFETFSESQHHNACLNCKISVSKNGDIKNCPSMDNSYGNLSQDINLRNIIENKTFKRFWDISKDKVLVCKDCEYRYCCTDCRVFIDDLNNELSRPSKCNYNPYQGLWKGEKGYIDVNNFSV